jgi:hypothetical protein
MPPIEQLQRVPALMLGRLQHQGIFTTGLLLEVSETATRRVYLADQVGVSTNDVHDWRDEALLLNLAALGPDEQRILTQAGITGLGDVLELEPDAFRQRVLDAARTLDLEPPADLTIQGWHDQARTLDEG